MKRRPVVRVQVHFTTTSEYNFTASAISDNFYQPFIRKIRTSSIVLSLASRVFDAMLKLEFREGQDLAESRTVEIPLPDDDPEAMLALCQVLHHRTSDMAALTSDRLLAIALLSDKYDCAGALQVFSSYWLREQSLGASQNDRQRLLTAAYLFRNSAQFVRCALDLIIHSTEAVESASSTSLCSVTRRSSRTRVSNTKCRSLPVLRRD